MSADPKLLQTLIGEMTQGNSPAFFLNKPFDVYNWAQNIFKEIEDKRSSVTAITREQISQIGKDNLHFSNSKHESRINALYRLIGLPTELNLLETIHLMDANGNIIENKKDLTKKLLEREYEQLKFTFNQFIQSNNISDLNTKINSTQKQDIELIAELFDTNYLQNHTTRLFPMVQYSQIQNIVEAENRIAPSFASTQERYVGAQLMQPPFLESVIVIRLLPQSGATQIKDSQGNIINSSSAIEDIIIKSLGFALSELAKQYHRNQSDAEKLLLDGIAKIRDSVTGINSPFLKKGSLDANTRENDGIITSGDIRSTYTKTEINLYESIISLLPLENDVIPIDIDFDGRPFETRHIKENALTSAFAEIIKSNLAALQRAQEDEAKMLKKRQTIQDKLVAEIGSLIGSQGGISLAEVVIIISALFVLDEEDLLGLLSKSRFDQLVTSSNNTTTSNSNKENASQKQINIFEILKQYQNGTNGVKQRTGTTLAVNILQNTIKKIYDSFVIQLAISHTL